MTILGHTRLWFYSTWIFWAVLSYTGLYWATLGYTWLYWAIQSYTELNLLGYTELLSGIRAILLLLLLPFLSEQQCDIVSDSVSQSVSQWVCDSPGSREASASKNCILQFILISGKIKYIFYLKCSTMFDKSSFSITEWNTHITSNLRYACVCSWSMHLVPAVTVTAHIAIVFIGAGVLRVTKVSVEWVFLIWADTPTQIWN